MYRRYERPKILEPKLWELFDPNETITKINTLREKIEQVRKDYVKYSENEIDQIQKSFTDALEKLIFLIEEHLVWFNEQELTGLIANLDTSPSSRPWEANREYAFDILKHCFLIIMMAHAARFAFSDISLLNSLKKK